MNNLLARQVGLIPIEQVNDFTEVRNPFGVPSILKVKSAIVFDKKSACFSSTASQAKAIVLKALNFLAVSPDLRCFNFHSTSCLWSSSPTYSRKPGASFSRCGSSQEFCTAARGTTFVDYRIAETGSHPGGFLESTYASGCAGFPVQLDSNI